ncbi:MAG: phosphatase PAP2 family protein [Firmicutes bacterium]|nr:phosphatase PAP2 family protein [Bacillota bacterium]
MDIKEGAQALSTGLECNRLFSISMKLRKLALLLLVAYVISGLGVQAAKRFVPRDRPGAVLAGVHYPYDIIIRKQDILKGDNSFPSGHTSITFAAATVAFLSIDSVWGFLILLLAMLVGISRVYLGVHYPSDVIAGMMLGILSGYIALWIPVVRKKKKVGYRI